MQAIYSEENCDKSAMQNSHLKPVERWSTTNSQSLRRRTIVWN